MKYACRRAKQWHGALGEQRKVHVCDFVHRDRYDSGWEERTTSCTIFTIDSHGTRTVYRQFVRSPEGCILEKFGDQIMDSGDMTSKPKKVKLGYPDFHDPYMTTNDLISPNLRHLI